MTLAELSLCMIVRNEEERLARCLRSVQGAVDEIVIVDTGSMDGTKAIAAAFTDRVFDFAWRDDFAAARNASMAYATKPYILWLDADDVLERSEREKLIALKKRLDGTVDAVMMPYHYAHREDGKLSLSITRGGRETYRQKDDSRHDVRMLIVDGRTGEVATSLAYDL